MDIQKISAHVRNLKRSAYAALALALAAAAALPFLAQEVFASGQVQTRSIEMSSAIPGNQPGGTGVSYQVTFTPATNETNPDVVIDFCSNDPIIGDSCTATAGTDVPNFSSVNTSTPGWSVTPLASNRGVKLTTTSVSFTAGTPITPIVLTGVTNPSNIGTFYGRILVYANGTAGTHTSDSPGSYVDYGGAALSITQTISITAKVMEQLTFCTSGNDGQPTPGDPFVTVGPSCTNATTPALTLGHTLTSGGPQVLTTDQVDTDSAYTLISTNATTGAVVRMKATNTCTNGGLTADGDTTCAIGGVGDTAAAIAAGDGTFGMCVTPNTANTVAVAPYDSASCTDYGMDNSSGTAVTSTYGSPVVNTNNTTVHTELDKYTFAATASNTTPAGIYTGGESLIATGTF